MQAIGLKIITAGSLKNSNTTKMENETQTIDLQEEVQKELSGANQTKPTEKQPQVPQQRLQWIKGDKLGVVETVVGEEGEWVTFASGGRISKALKHEYMLDVAEGMLPADELNLQQAARPVQSQQKAPASPPPSKTPISILLDKSSQYDELEVAVRVKIKAPKASLLAVLRDSFGDEAMAEVEEHIMSQVNLETLEESTKAEVKQLLKSLG